MRNNDMQPIKTIARRIWRDKKTIERRNDDNHPHSLGSFGQWQYYWSRQNSVVSWHAIYISMTMIVCGGKYSTNYERKIMDNAGWRVNISLSYIERGGIGWEGLCVILLLTLQEAACFRAQLRRAILTWEICFSDWSVSSIASHLLEERRHTSLILVHHIYMFADDVLPVTSKWCKDWGSFADALIFASTDNVENMLLWSKQIINYV